MMSYILNSGICPGVYLAGIRVPASDIYALPRYCDAYIFASRTQAWHCRARRGNEKHYISFTANKPGKTTFLQRDLQEIYSYIHLYIVELRKYC